MPLFLVLFRRAAEFFILNGEMKEDRFFSVFFLIAEKNYNRFFFYILFKRLVFIGRGLSVLRHRNISFGTLKIFEESFLGTFWGGACLTAMNLNGSIFTIP